MICLSHALTSPASTRCSKVTMPLLLLSLSLSRSSSDSATEDPVDEMEELDSFLRRGPSTTSSMSSCCISREQPPPSGVMVTCGTGRPSITAGGSLAHDPEIRASSRARDDLSAALAGRRETSADALPEAFRSFEARLLHSLGIGRERERTAHGERRTVNRQISSSHSCVQDKLPGCWFSELSDANKPCALLERGTPLWRRLAFALRRSLRTRRAPAHLRLARSQSVYLPRYLSAASWQSTELT